MKTTAFWKAEKTVTKSRPTFIEGVSLITQLITVAVIVFGGASIVHASLDLADLITFLLYIGNLIEPIQKLTHMTQQFQEGITGFERFMEIMEVEPGYPGRGQCDRITACSGKRGI